MNIPFLKECDTEYYNTGKSLISDIEYDILKEQLKADKPDDPYFKTIGAPVAGSTVELPYILGSLTKTKPNGSLSKWCTDNNIKLLCLSDKLDGVSIYARYENGVLVQASTRGDGYHGKDITEKIRMVQPTIYSGSGIIELRGEAVMTPENRDKLDYTLARSAVSGILNGDDQEHYDKMKYVDLVFYTPLGVSAEDWPSMFFNLERIEVPVVPYATMNVTLNIEERLELYFRDRKECSNWDIDGIVVANYHDTSVGEDYYPENIVAFKIAADAVETEVVGVEWNVSRNGRVVPTVIVNPVVIDGSTITRATGFNYKYIKDNNIGIGRVVGVIKSGDVIPHLIM